MLTQNLASGLKRGHGRRLAEAGATAKLIMSVLGRTTLCARALIRQIETTRPESRQAILPCRRGRRRLKPRLSSVGNRPCHRSELRDSMVESQEIRSRPATSVRILSVGLVGAVENQHAAFGRLE